MAPGTGDLGQDVRVSLYPMIESMLVKGLGFEKLDLGGPVFGIDPMRLGDVQLFRLRRNGVHDRDVAIVLFMEDYGMFVATRDSAKNVAFLLGAMEYVPHEPDNLTKSLADYMSSRVKEW